MHDLTQEEQEQLDELTKREETPVNVTMSTSGADDPSYKARTYREMMGVPKKIKISGKNYEMVEIPMVRQPDAQTALFANVLLLSLLYRETCFDPATGTYDMGAAAEKFSGILRNPATGEPFLFDAESLDAFINGKLFPVAGDDLDALMAFTLLVLETENPDITTEEFKPLFRMSEFLREILRNFIEQNLPFLNRF